MGETGSLARLLAEFGRSTGLGDLGLGDDGICALSFDDHLVLHIAPDARPGAAALYVKLGDAVPEGRQQGVYRRMLEANLSSGPQGSSLALDERDGSPVLIQRAMVEHMPYPEFERMVEGLVGSAEAWIEALEASAALADEPVAPGAGMGGPDLGIPV
jgi:hypothetical protein